MNKRQIFIRTLKTVVLISAVWAALLVYAQNACASYEVGNFSGGFAIDSDGHPMPPTEHWHTVTITHSGKLVLNFTLMEPLSVNASLLKPDKSSGAIAYAPISYASNTSLTADHLAPGTYYIKVSLFSRYGTYTIQAVFTNADDNMTESEPNDTIDAAKPFTDNQVTGIIGYTDYIKTDTEDWFRYEVTRSGKLVLNFTLMEPLSVNASLLKPDKSSGAIAYAPISYASNTSLTADHLSPGTYYIKVLLFSRYGTYTIQAVFTPDVSALGLQDEIVCLRILSGISVSFSDIIITDISKDGRIGMEECVYILQAVAGLRP